MDNCQKIVSDCNGVPVIEPKKVLERSALEAQSPGSSTILVAYFDGQVIILLLRLLSAVDILLN